MISIPTKIFLTWNVRLLLLWVLLDWLTGILLIHWVSNGNLHYQSYKQNQRSPVLRYFIESRQAEAVSGSTPDPIIECLCAMPMLLLRLIPSIWVLLKRVSTKVRKQIVRNRNFDWISGTHAFLSHRQRATTAQWPKRQTTGASVRSFTMVVLFCVVCRLCCGRVLVCQVGALCTLYWNGQRWVAVSKLWNKTN